MEVWFVGNFPPPVHGVSELNRALRDHFDRVDLAYRIFPVGSRGSLAEVGQPTVSKTFRDLGVIARIAIAGARARSRPVIYFTASQEGLVIARDRGLVEVAARLGMPLVAHIHGCAWVERFRAGGPRARVMLATLRACTTVICLGQRFATRVRQETGVTTVGINNGVPDDDRLTSLDRPRLGGRVELLFLSNLMRAKGLWVAAEAVELLAARGMAVRLRCAGLWKSPDEERAFRDRFSHVLATRTVELVGFADAATKRSLFASSHLLVLPITNPLEGQPLSIIEAMAAGVVPVVTRHLAIGELFDFDGGATLADDRHLGAAAVADTITGLVSTQVGLDDMSRRCRQHYERALTAERCHAAITGVLEAASRRSRA